MSRGAELIAFGLFVAGVLTLLAGLYLWFGLGPALVVTGLCLAILAIGVDEEWARG